MLSIKKVNAGRGYEYLQRSVVHGDADYYLRGTTHGDPPGVWMIRGNRNSIAGLDLTFSPPKSWSVLWASARPARQDREQQAPTRRAGPYGSW